MVIIRDKPPAFSELVGYVANSVIAIAVGSTKDGVPNIVGTGFALEQADFYATCAHVAKVEDELRKLSQAQLDSKGLKDSTLRIGLLKNETFIWHELGKDIPWVRGVSEQHDSCIFRTFGITAPPLSLQEGDIWALGAEVGIIGFPLGNYLQGKTIRPFVLKTVISGALEVLLEEGKNTPRLALGTAVANGFSGAPVFSSENGQVVGMVASDLRHKGLPAGISLAVTPELLREGLKRGVEDVNKYLIEIIKKEPS